MLKLRGKVETRNTTTLHPSLAHVTRNANLPAALRKKTALLLKGADVRKLTEDFVVSIRSSKPFSALLLCGTDEELDLVKHIADAVLDVYLLPSDYGYLDEGDIVRLNPSGQSISAVFRKNAPNNSILLTERCNHLCLMCSQPPKSADDSWLMDDAFELIRMIPQGTENIGFTGGEPTTYGDRFIELVNTAKVSLPGTSLDVLTNGRSFKNEAYAEKLGRVKHPDLQLGIPLYSDDPVRHDYIVQSQGAFDETIHGILNLKRHGVRVEVRVVVHQQSLPRLVQTCEFIARNLLFVDHVALMGLEITGFTRANLDSLWADPYTYRDTLSEAIEVLRAYGMHCSVYNHQLCLVNRDVEDVYRKSISDWKNEYLPQCGSCARKSECGGFFSTQVMYRHSENISPFL
ncbi:His-Xaa-Ser system radical SAM maturase HxsC [Noviherbaspirillum soli]|uniref:His-Xaa-Ser system radical SAM maturase HxsC n=1 Tax=Noviherbaspirillum soli TaxID=1064518 RepID=UPI00188AAF7B|nr:His-Xaa-Ser system radical SAM maturase HxsC [Noviherbaspirillum soli]